MSIEDLKTKQDLERFVNQVVEGTPINQLAGMPEAVLPTPWVEMPLINEWQPLANPSFNEGAFYRQLAGGLVSLKGIVSKAVGAASTILAQLPAGSRPNKIVVVPAVRDGVCEPVFVHADGSIQYVGAAGAVGYLALDGVQFWAGA